MRPHPPAGRSGENRHRPARRSLGALPDSDCRQSPAGSSPGARRRRQRPPRRRIRPLLALGTNRRFALVLVGGRTGGKARGTLRRRPGDLLRIPVGTLPRHLPQRRGLGTHAVGRKDLRAGARQHRAQNLRQNLRTAAAPQGQLPRPGHAPRFHVVQPDSGEQAGGRHLRHSDGLDPLRATAAEHRQRVGHPNDGPVELRPEQGGHQPRARTARTREQPL